MMFSRTTIASSIRMPTDSDSAISVIMLMVKPNAAMTMKVPISAIGSVRPVITVERQEFRNRKTMATVSRPPSISVCCTLSTEFRMPREPSRTISSFTPGGSGLLQLGHRLAHAARHLDGVLALRLDDVDGERALAVEQRRRSRAPARRRPRWRPGAGRPARRRGGRRSGRRSCPGRRCGRRPRPRGPRCRARRCRPGSSGSRRAPPVIMSLTPTRSACMRPGSRSMLICALDAADDRGAADAAHVLQALDDDLVGQCGQLAHRADVRAHRDRHDRLVVGIEAQDQRLLDLVRNGGADRWTFSRTSCRPPATARRARTRR